MESILTSIKKLLGIEEDYKHFDDEIIMQINAALSSANMLGVGPPEGFFITDASAVWSDLIGDRKDLHFIKTYVWHKVRLGFDPPQMGYLVDAIKSQIQELEWRLNVQIETPASESNDTVTGGGSNELVWKPTITADGDISWFKSSSITPPEPVNIMGPPGKQGQQGIQGEPGVGFDDAEADDNLYGRKNNDWALVPDIPASSVDLMFFSVEGGKPVLNHISPTSHQVILPTTYFSASPGVWHDIADFTIGSDLHGTELEFIPGNSFTAKIWITSDMARDNAQFRLSAINRQNGDQLATGTISVDLGTTGIPSPVIITGLYEIPAVVPAEEVLTKLQILTPLFGVQIGLISTPPNEISYIARLISGGIPV